ncbi:MAG: YqhA family protein [Sulfurovum sp.]|nr:YqhA family protein [Sulfurovum sp.]MCB4745445.1 YqhA family protein [Sulfurovum sp.]MCB4745654.1 YqhA family protein [Sulfurovum sp.]MCB4747431.1 YqhA family protein [Sulfurovum sp.]MCB4748912.1 YqhA family protein [Sulfurovum sp.]
MKEKTHADKKQLQEDLLSQSWYESTFENILWSTRFFVLLAVIFSMIGGISLFIVASIDVWHVAVMVFENYFGHAVHVSHFHEKIVTELIGAVDLYLIAIVLFIFGFGLYELFISQIDVAKKSAASKILEIHSLDELKDKLAKVIIMVLIVGFFKRAMNTTYTEPLEMLYLASAILGLALSFYFMHKGDNH